MVKGRKVLDRQEHTAVLGMTGSGKTFFTNNYLRSKTRGVLFFNIQHIRMKGYIKANIKTDLADIISALRKGEKITYYPSLDDDLAGKELALITRELFKAKLPESKKIIFVIDEAPAFKTMKVPLSAMKKVFNRGRSFGIEGWALAQRGAVLDLNVFLACSRVVFFQTAFHDSYYKEKGIDMNKVDGILGDQRDGEFPFCIVRGKNIYGPYEMDPKTRKISSRY